MSPVPNTWYEFIFTNAIEGILIVDVDMVIQQANPYVARILSYDNPEQIVGQSVERVIELNPQQLQLPRGLSQEHYFRLRPRDDREVWAIVIVTPLFDAQGQYAGSLIRLRDTTERKHLLDEIQKKSLALEAVLDGIAILTPKGIITYVNPAFARLFGYNFATELRGKAWQELFAPEAVLRLTAEAFAVLQQTRHWRGEALAQRKDQTHFWAEQTLTTTPDGSIICVCRDITERVTYETALQRSEMWFRAAVEGSPDAFFMLELTPDQQSFTFVEINRWAAELFQANRNQVLNFPVEMIQHPLLAKLLPQYHQVVQTGKPIEAEFSDHNCWYWHQVVPLPNGVAVTLRDISERKQAEAAIRNSEQRYRLLAEYSTDIISRHAPNGRFTYVSPACKSLLGYQPMELVGHSLFSFVHEHDRPRVELAFQIAVNNGISNSVSYRALCKENGSSIWLETIFQPVRQKDSKVVYEVIATSRDITQRRQMEEELVISNERLRLALEVSNDGLWDYNLLTGEWYVSPRCLGILGYQEGELVPHLSEWRNYVHPEDQEQALALLRSHLVGASSYYEVELRLKNRQQKWLWMQVRGQVVERDPNTHQPLRMLGTVTDITDRKQIQILLQEREAVIKELYRITAERSLSFQEKLHALLELGCNYLQLEGGALTHVQDFHSDVVVVDSVGYLFGQTIPIDTFCDLFCGEVYQHYSFLSVPNITSSEYANHPSQRVMRLETYIGARVEVGDRPYGVLCFYSTSPPTRPIQPADTEIIRLMVQWIVADLERQQRNAELKNQFERLLLLKDITNRIRSSLDSREIFQVAAEQLGKALGVSRCVIHTYDPHRTELPIVAEYLSEGVTSLWHLQIPVVNNPHAQAVLGSDNAIVTNNVYTDLYLAEMQDLCAQVQLKSMITVRTSYNGQPNGVIGLHQCDRWREWTKDEIDFVESIAGQLGIAIAQAQLLETEKLRRQEMEQAKIMAEQSSRAKSEFLAMMSHEIRTPMNAVLGMTHLVLQDSYLSAEHREALETVESSGKALLNILNDILDLSKIESGKLELENRPFDIRQITQDIYQLMQHLAQEKNIRFNYAIGADVPRQALGDSTRVKQILVNLLSNAIKFTAKGEVELQLNLHQGKFLFRVRDTGIGIPPDLMDRIFQPFMQGDASTTRQYGGTGLGLSISRRLCEMMQGNLWVESNGHRGGDPPPDWHSYSITPTGTTFCVLLPLPVISEPMPAPTAPASPDEDLTMSLRILLAEDNPVNQKVATRLLQRLGYYVDVVNHGLEAVKAAQTKDYDVVFLDVQMPEMDGLTAARQIKAQCQPAPYLIAMTANAMQGDREECLAAGMDDYLSKPIRIEDVSAALLRWQHRQIAG
ncbi:MAG: PAS domain S-box protein [Pseudanabaenaceae cyanobacterium]